MKLIFAFFLIALLTSCESTTTTTTTTTGGKQTVVVMERKVDGNIVSKISEGFLAGAVSIFGNKQTP